MADARASAQPGLWNLLRAAAMGGTMLVAACVGPGRGYEPEAPPPVERPVARPEPRPIQPGLPQDVERHRIALLVPLSGPNAGVGRSLQNATQLAILDTKNDEI